LNASSAIFFLFILLSACAFKGKTQTSTSCNQVDEIRWGTSFGLCRGYCYTEHIYHTDSVMTIRKGWDKENYPEQITSETLDVTRWNTLCQAIALDSFFQLPERIGCPDCADGGSEWIELRSGNKKHKVTFEFGSHPDGTHRLLEELRK